MGTFDICAHSLLTSIRENIALVEDMILYCIEDNNNVSLFEHVDPFTVFAEFGENVE